MKQPIRLTESDLTKIVKRILAEQAARQPYKFPIDVIITDGKIINPKKITIPKGSIMTYDQRGNGQVKVGNGLITYNPEENSIPNEQYALTLRINNQPYILQWADSIFGVVYNKEYEKIGNSI